MRSAPPLSSDKSSSSSASSITSSLSFLPIQKMIKLWPSNILADQITPKATADGHERLNPFELQSHLPSSRSSTNGLATPTLLSPGVSIHHHLLGTANSSSNAANADLTPPGPITPPSGAFAARIPTTQISLHAPDFSMRNTKKSTNLSDSMESKSNTPSSSSPSTRTSSIASTSTASPHSTGTSKGQIHVKLISARGLNVTSVRSRPYVVVQFEQNEFVSRDPTDEMDKEVKGTATALSRASSSIALSALSSIGVPRPPGKASAGNSPSSSLSCNQPSPINLPSTTQGLFGRLSAHNPVWKHEVSL
jgi:hypothetical protein